MRLLYLIANLLDNLLYIAASICIFVAAFKGSIVWVCVCGFILIDEALTFIHRENREKEDNT